MCTITVSNCHEDGAAGLFECLLETGRHPTERSSDVFQFPRSPPARLQCSSLTVILYQREDLAWRKAFPSIEEGQFDHKRSLHHFATKLTGERNGRFGRPTCGQKIINH